MSCETPFTDRKSTRLNSSHSQISYAVFCLKKKWRAGVAIVCADADLAIGRDVDVVGPEPYRHIVLGVGDLLPIYREQRDLVGRELGGERTLAVGRDGHRGHLVSHRHREIGRAHV